MKLEKVLVLLPCYSLESLSLERSAEHASGLLAAWSALYHPRLVAAAGVVPRWQSAEEVPGRLAGALVCVPQVCEGALAAEWDTRAESEEMAVIRGLADREAIVAAALASLGGADGQAEPLRTADFLALGYCRLQVELLTRQLRYMSNLDEQQFEKETVAAARASVAGDDAESQKRLQKAFDLLTEAREYFYPVEPHLVDLTLVAPTTMGQALIDQLAGSSPSNLLLSAADLEIMAAEHPATLAALREALEAGRATVVGGEYRPARLPLLPVEAVRENLERGLAVYEHHLGQRPRVFARRPFGLSPLLPQVLARTGFRGALHFTLDDGRFPTGNQSKVRWRGLDGTQIDALTRLPIEAHRPELFLKLCTRLGDVMDLDHVATAVFAHWPGQTTCWYEDLRRMDAYSPVLGRFASMQKYFESTQHAGQQVDYGPDGYRSPYLGQMVNAAETDPVSRHVRYYQRRAKLDAARALFTLAAAAATAGGLGGTDLREPALRTLATEIEDQLAAASGEESDLDTRLDAAVSDAEGALAAAVAGAGRAPAPGHLLLNATAQPRRTWIDVSDLAGVPDTAGAVRVAAGDGAAKEAVVEIPPFGFAWVGAGAGERPRRRSWFSRKPPEEPPLVEGPRMRNEFLEVRFCETTGAIRNVTAYSSRGARIAQQLALRMPRPGRRRSEDEEELEKDYSVMALDEMQSAAGPASAAVTCRGRILDRNGSVVARYTQTTTLPRQSPIVDIDVTLDVDRPPVGPPWDHYYAARFAWSDETVDFTRNLGGVVTATENHRIESPLFIDLRREKTATTILCGGLPFHRRYGLRKLDTLLVTAGERQRRFRLGIGIDLANPAAAAVQWLAPASHLAKATRPPADHGWLFHVGARNVLATHTEPLLAEDRVAGVRMRLLETQGREVRTALRCLYPLKAARRFRAPDEAPGELAIDGDKLSVAIPAYGWIDVEAHFAR